METEVTPAARRAGFWQRGLALLIDGVIAAAGIGLVGFTLTQAYLSTFPRDADGAALLATSAGAVILWLYGALFESGAEGATPGKRLVGLQVRRLDGLELGFWRASARAAAKALSSVLLMLGFLLGAGRSRLALHDRITGTQVLRGER